MNLQNIVDQVKSLVEETAGYVRNERNKWHVSDAEHKADQSLVTSIDKNVEQRLVEALGRIVPGSGFLAEEFHSTEEEGPLTWIIDPIDGTTNMVHNVPMYCISIALRREKKTVLGVIYEITSGECFWAHDDKPGAWLGAKSIQVSRAAGLKQSLITTGFPMSAFRMLDEYIEHFRYFMENTQGLRRAGSAAMDLAYVACGRYDGFFEYNLSPWDVAAGAYLVKKAGGQVTDFSGGDDYLFGRQMLASNGFIHDALTDRFSKKDKKDI